MNKKVTFACPSCGSTEVTIDATARRSVQLQQWLLSDTQDECSCHECGGSSGSYKFEVAL